MEKPFQIEELAKDLQPQETVQFLSLSAVKGKRGVIKNRCSDPGYVKIVATYADGTKTWAGGDVYVLVTAVHRTPKGEYIPSRYFVQKCGLGEKFVNWDLFTEEMTKVGNKFEYELKDAFIFSPFDKEHNAVKMPELYKESAFMKKYEQYLKFKYELTDEQRIGNQIKEMWKESGKQKYFESVCLAFELFEVDAFGKKVKFLSEPVYSNVIYNGAKEFKIIRLCNTHVPNDGQSDMTLLLSEGKAVNIYFLQPVDESNRELEKWEAKQPEYTLHDTNAAISFKVPMKELPADELVARHIVSIEIDLKGAAVESASRRAKSVTFYYVNLNFGGDLSGGGGGGGGGRKRGPSDDPTGEADSIETSIQMFRRFRQPNQSYNDTEITYGHYDSVHTSKYGTSMFFGALRRGNLNRFIQLDLKGLNSYMAKVTNEQYQTLLHYACEIDRHQDIAPLVKIGCPIASPCLQTYETPLHIAIRYKHQNCVDEFNKILKNFSDWGAQTIVPLMLHHNHHGYTVTHAAAANGLVPLMESILAFCENVQIKVLEMPILSLQYTLLDLAVLNGHKEMEELILKALEKLGHGSGHDGSAGGSASGAGVSSNTALHNIPFLPPAREKLHAVSKVPAFSTMHAKK